jgi:hypothetical protein
MEIEDTLLRYACIKIGRSPLNTYTSLNFMAFDLVLKHQPLDSESITLIITEV